MKSLKHKRALLRRLKVSQPILVFRDLVGLAISSNPYDRDTEIRVLLYLKLGMYRELVQWADAISRTVYENPEEHYRMHQIANLIRKYPFPSEVLDLGPEAEAVKKFKAAERRCERVNAIFRAYNKGLGRRFHTELNIARKWVEYVVGESPNLQSIADKMDFSEGASIGIHGNATNFARKLAASDWSVTPGCVPYALGGLWSNFHMREYILASGDHASRSYSREASGEQYIDTVYCVDRDSFEQNVAARIAHTCHNNIAFVPKTAKTHRAIAVEPTLNTFVQRGIDLELRNRLKRVGLDLTDQTTNQELAMLGSMDEEDP